MSALLTTHLVGLQPASSGKVREIYDLGEEILIVTTDRISAFDVIMANGIPDKGAILNKMSAYWFGRLRPDCPNHVISTDDKYIAVRLGHDYPELYGRCTLAKKAKPLPIECVARGYLAGSLYKEYVKYGPKVHDLDLPQDLPESGYLEEPIFTPATKATEGHDQNLSWDETVDLVGKEIAEQARDLTLALYRDAAEHSFSRGLILADTKFEFGETDDGLLWIDEALTPDSSRYWDLGKYSPGGPQPSYDKQFVRDYLESISWDKRPPGPTLPEEVVEKTREKYLQAYALITGEKLHIE